MAAPAPKQKAYRREAIPDADRSCVTALCCVHAACYTKWPECCGQELIIECCGCCQTAVSTKCLDTQYHPCKCTGQYFCFDCRSACPTDAEVPCELSILGCTMYKSKKDAPPAAVPAGQLQGQLQMTAPQQQQIQRQA